MTLMKNEPIRLIDRQEVPSSSSWTLLDVIEDSIEGIKSGNLPNKGMIIFLDNSDGISVDWKKAGIKDASAIVLLELLKKDFIDKLGEI